MILNLFQSHSFYRFWVFVLIAFSTLLISSVAYAAPATSSSSDGHYYYVEQGDTLSGIARRYGVSVGELVYFNSLGNADIIRVGQPLYIPSRSDSGGQECHAHHTVARGETLSQIAKHYGVDLHELAEYNHIYNMDHIRTYQVLCIPLWPIESIGIESDSVQNELAEGQEDISIVSDFRVIASSAESLQWCRSHDCNNAVCDSSTWRSFSCKLNGCCDRPAPRVNNSFNRVVIGIVFQTLIPGLSRPMGSAILPIASYDIAIEEQRTDFSPQTALLTGETQIVLVRPTEFRDGWVLFTVDETASELECADVNNMFWKHTKSDESLSSGIGGRTEEPYDYQLPIIRQCTFPPNITLGRILNTQGPGSNIDFLITQESQQIYRLYYDVDGFKAASQGLAAQCKAVGCNQSICRRDGDWSEDREPKYCRWVRPIDDWSVPRCCSLWPR